MTPVSIRCPACHKALRCPDRSILAHRRARCPACQHQFWAEVRQARPAATSPAFRNRQDRTPLGVGEYSEAEAPANTPHLVRPMVQWGLIGGVTLLGLTVLWYVLGTAGPTQASSDQAVALAREQQALARSQEQREKQEEALARLLDQGQAARAQNRLPEAEKLYTEALRISPHDIVAVEGLRAVHQAQTEYARQVAGQEQQQAEVRALTSRGRQALANGDLAAASQAFAKALELQPDDRGLMEDLKAVRELLVQLKAADEKDQQFLAHVKTAETFMAARRYQDARQEYEAALKLRPVDSLVTKGLQRAEDQLTIARSSQARAEQESEARRQAKEAEQAREARRAEDARQRNEFWQTVVVSQAQVASAQAQAAGQVGAAQAQAAGQIGVAQIQRPRWHQVPIFNKAGAIIGYKTVIY